MKDIFAQLIIDFHKTTLPVPSTRDVHITMTSSKVRKVHVFVGMRRSGKTWTMYQRMHQLKDSGVDIKQILYLNFEDDRLGNLTLHDLQAILDAYFELYPDCVTNNNLHFFFDEIHEVKGWEKFIRRLLDQETMQIYISGSSAKMLAKEIATTLRGRTLVYEVFPFSFREYLTFKKIDYTGAVASKEKAHVTHHMKEYLRHGGFPEIVLSPLSLHRELLRNYIDVVIYRDIIERYHITNIHVVRELIVFCLQNSASLISINKLYQRFKSQGYTLSKNSLYQYMQYLEDAYCIFSVPLFSFSHAKQVINPKKIYTVDPGFISAYTLKPEWEMGSCLETAVFCQIRRMTEDIFYYKTREGNEVDFLLLLPEGKRALYQACVSLQNEETCKREVDALREAMEELNLTYGTIITLDDTKKAIKIKQGNIDCIPISEWCIKGK